MVHNHLRRRESHPDLCCGRYFNSDCGVHPSRTASAPPGQESRHLEGHQTLVVSQLYANTVNLNKCEHLNECEHKSVHRADIDSQQTWENAEGQ